jgi:hypothetical protein
VSLAPFFFLRTLSFAIHADVHGGAANSTAGLTWWWLVVQTRDGSFESKWGVAATTQRARIFGRSDRRGRPAIFWCGLPVRMAGVWRSNGSRGSLALPADGTTPRRSFLRSTRWRGSTRVGTHRSGGGGRPWRGEAAG